VSAESDLFFSSGIDTSVAMRLRIVEAPNAAPVAPTIRRKYAPVYEISSRRLRRSQVFDP
jgi:hypothetical protein